MRWREAFSATVYALSQAYDDRLPVASMDLAVPTPWVACTSEAGLGAAQIFTALGLEYTPAPAQEVGPWATTNTGGQPVVPASGAPAYASAPVPQQWNPGGPPYPPGPAYPPGSAYADAPRRVESAFPPADAVPPGAAGPTPGEVDDSAYADPPATPTTDTSIYVPGGAAPGTSAPAAGVPITPGSAPVSGGGYPTPGPAGPPVSGGGYPVPVSGGGYAQPISGPPVSGPPVSGPPGSAPAGYGAPTGYGQPPGGYAPAGPMPPAYALPGQQPAYGQAPAFGQQTAFGQTEPARAPRPYSAGEASWSLEEDEPAPAGVRMRWVIVVGLVALLAGIGGGIAVGTQLRGSSPAAAPSATPTPTPSLDLGLPARAPAEPGVEPPVNGGWPQTYPSFKPTDKLQAMPGATTGFGFDFQVPLNWTCQQTAHTNGYVKMTCNGGANVTGEVIVRHCPAPCMADQRTSLRKQEEAFGLTWVRSGPFASWADSNKIDGASRYGLVYVGFWRSVPEGPLNRELVFRMTSPVNRATELREVVNSIRDVTFTL
jgi:hypothetical protein